MFLRNNYKKLWNFGDWRTHCLWFLWIEIFVKHNEFWQGLICKKLLLKLSLELSIRGILMSNFLICLANYYNFWATRLYKIKIAAICLSLKEAKELSVKFRSPLEIFVPDGRLEVTIVFTATDGRSTITLFTGKKLDEFNKILRFFSIEVKTKFSL